MQTVKRLVIYLLLAAILAMLVFTLLNAQITDCFYAVTRSRGSTAYELVSLDDAGDVWALGMRGGKLTLTAGTTAGKRVRTLHPARLEGWPEASQVLELWAAEDGVMITLRDVGQTPSKLLVLHLAGDGTVTQLVNREETGEPVRVTSFARYDENVYFGVWQDGSLETYAYQLSDGALTELNGISCRGDFIDAVVYADGSAALAQRGGTVTFTNTSATWRAPSGLIADLYPSPLGLYYLDGADGLVRLLDASGAKALPAADASQQVAFPAARDVNRSGDVLELSSDGGLYLTKDGQVTDCSSALYQSVVVSILVLVGLTAAVLFVAYALWYLLCVHHKEQISMVVRYGIILTVIVALCAGLALRLGIEPYSRDAARNQARENLRVVTALWSGKTDQAGLAGLAQTVQSTDALNGAEATLWTLNGDVWVRSATSDGGQTGLCARALGLDETFLQALEQAEQTGTAFLSREAWGKLRYCYYLGLGDGQVVSLDVNGAALLENAQAADDSLVYILLVLCLAVLVCVLSMLGRIVGGIRRVAQGMDALDQEHLQVTVYHDSGDEVEGLADSFNAMAEKLAQNAESSSVHESAYLRFVPRELVTLLGASTIEDVNKQTVASRRMATVAIGYYFDDKVYESRTRELFDNINQVIERTADLVTKNKGIICNYSEDGYTALFDCDSDIAVSTAVAIRQEILALNREREKQGQTSVRLCIAIDVADVMAGVLGNEYRMEVGALSAGFNTTRQLLTLFDRFEANILCTETVIARAKTYSSRYIGKTRDGAELIRVYEIYDGDAYAVRSGKAAMAQLFAEGIYLFYARDFSGAKRNFMDITRQHSQDGAARYYLYLADRYERNEPQVLSLDD